MNERPSKQDILDRFSEFLDSYDGDVEFSTTQPDPVEARRSGVILQFIGKIKGWSVWARKNAYGIVLAIVAYGGLPQGIATVHEHTRIAYNQATEMVSDVSATLNDIEFYAFDPPDDWPVQDDDPTTIRLNTTSPPYSIVELPSGSGIAPGPSGFLRHPQ